MASSPAAGPADPGLTGPSPPSEGCARLHLFQLVSPALPVGAFSYSEGLEVLSQSGRLPDGAAVAAWIGAELDRGVLALEAAALPELMAALTTWSQSEPLEERLRAQAQVRERDGWLTALREAPEVRAQQRQMGASLLGLLADLGWPLPPGPPGEPPLLLSWPSAWAWALVALALRPREGVEAYLYSWVANQLSAAVRLVPLGPTEAQRLQLRLGPKIARRAAELVEKGAQPRWCGGIGAAMAQLQHGELYSRLFRS
ncbi:MAG: urease accessory protein UreF [Cyanobacteriota bacterium]|jgi:urease accessory protein